MSREREGERASECKVSIIDKSLVIYTKVEVEVEVEVEMVECVHSTRMVFIWKLIRSTDRFIDTFHQRHFTTTHSSMVYNVFMLVRTQSLP